MDGLDGIQTYEEIKKIQPSIKAIVMTAYFEEGTIMACLHKGVLKYLQKPFEISNLLEIIKQL